MGNQDSNRPDTEPDTSPATIEIATPTTKLFPPMSPHVAAPASRNSAA